jgi:hypothetical protein
MTRKRSWWTSIWLVVPVAIGSMAFAGTPRGSGSAARAADLVSLMQKKSLQAFATPLPGQPDQFAAAMAFPDVQLLVVTARYPTPALLTAQLASKQYNDVYSELQGGSVKDSRIFFQDLGADGLGSQGGVDVMYERGVQMLFDGDWKRARLSKEAYETRLAAADQRYSDVLDALIGALKLP